MILKDKYAYNDLTIVPNKVSFIESRSECDVYDEYGMLPIFASPMASVVSEENYDVWNKNKIYAIIPRNIPFKTRLKLSRQGKWVAWSLSEFEELFVTGDEAKLNTRALIDVANGHMYKIKNLVIGAHNKCKQMKIMCGNVANPQTYLDYARWGVDYIRVGIGGGNCCITSSNTGIHYPMASLIAEMYEVKNQISTYYDDIICKPKIVADGGIRNYSDVIKALGLGADYVMIGTLFGGFYESAAPLNFVNRDTRAMIEYDEKSKTYTLVLGLETDKLRKYYQYQVNDDWGHTIYKLYSDVPSTYIQDEEIKDYIINNFKLTKNVFGMSTKKAQEAINGKATKTSEGVEKTVEVKYTISKWVDNMISYLKSAMSYSNAKSLYHFIGIPNFVVNSVSEQMVVNK